MKFYGGTPSISSQRGSAFAVDVAVLFLVFFPLALTYEGSVLGAISGLCALGYFLARDGLFSGRGFGKLACGIRLIDMRTGKPASIAVSAKKNIIPVAVVGLGFGIGWLFSLTGLDKIAGIVGSTVILSLLAWLYSGYQSDVTGAAIDHLTKTKVVFSAHPNEPTFKKNG